MGTEPSQHLLPVTLPGAGAGIVMLPRILGFDVGNGF